MGLGFVVPKNGNSMTTSTSRGGSSRKKKFQLGKRQKGANFRRMIFTYIYDFPQNMVQNGPAKKKGMGV
jgi:hypothetical protein